MSEFSRNQRNQRETPFGIVYGHSQAAQIVATLLAVPGGILILFLLLSRLLATSEFASAGIFIAAVSIVGFGYSIWMGRLSAIAFNKIGKGVLWSLFSLLVQRKKPESIQDVLPSKEALEEIAVAAQKAANSFAWVGFPLAVFFSALIGLGSKAMLWFTASLITFLFLFIYSYILAWLGRRGFLLLPEE